MNRDDQIKEASIYGGLDKAEDPVAKASIRGFVRGANWADQNPRQEIVELVLRSQDKMALGVNALTSIFATAQVALDKIQSLAPGVEEKSLTVDVGSTDSGESIVVTESV